MKDFELRYVAVMWRYTPAVVCSCFRPTQCGRPWKSWPGKRRHIASGKAECKMYVK